MRIIIASLCTVLIAFGMYKFLYSSQNYPSQKSKNAIKKTKYSQKKNFKTYIEPFLLKIACIIAKCIPLNTLREEEMQIMLNDANLHYTPKLFIARSITVGLLVSLFSIPLFFLFPLGSIAVLLLAIILGKDEYSKVYDISKDRKKMIEAELPRFAQHIAVAVQNTGNVRGIVESYQPMAGKTFGIEINKTIADMRTSDVQHALNRLSKRVGSSTLSKITRGLCSIDNGIDQGSYFQILAFTYKEEQTQLFKRVELKKPDKISSASLLSVLALLLQMGVILGTALLNNFSIFKI